MKEGLENIDEVFKQAFDGFEANVDPSVWVNVQNAIGSNVAASTTSSVVGKSVALKIVAGVIAIGTIATGAYFVSDNFTVKNKEVISENIVYEDNTVETIEEIKAPIFKENKIEKDSELNDENISNSIEEKEIAIKKTIVVEALLVVSNEEAERESADNTSKSVTVVGGENETSNKENKDGAVAVKVKEQILQVHIKTNVAKGKAPLDVDFDIDGDNVVSYLWDFGDGETAKNSNPTHTFYTAGTYNVSLLVMDKNRRTKTIPYQIIVENENKAYLDKSAILRRFSPNGDGIKDVLKVDGKNIKSFRAQIFNMSGKKVFEWNSLEGFWDGRDMLGNMVQKGTYMLTVTAIGEDGEKIPPIQQSVSVY